MNISPKPFERILLTGGRAPATLDLARQFAAAGHHVYMAESCPAHLCLGSRAIVRNFDVPKPNDDPDAYMEALKQIIVQEEIDWLIPTCEEVFHVARGLGRLSPYCHVFTDSLDTLLTLHSKWTFIRRVEELGLLVPETHELQSMEDVQAVLARPGKWVFKPVFSRFASKVFIVEASKVQDKTKLRQKLKQLSADDPWVAQQFIEGTAYCTYGIAKRGRLTAHAVYPVRFTAGRGACISFEGSVQPDIERWVQRLVQAEQFTGQIAFDFIVTQAGDIYPIECNPRATSGIHLFQAADRLDQAFFHDEEAPQPLITPQSHHKAMILFGMLSYGLISIRSWSRFIAWFRLLIGGKDIIFRFRDLRPFFQQFKLLWWNVKVSRQRRISILEATTHDIEWNGGEIK